jgi:serine/threonine protein kinase
MKIDNWSVGMTIIELILGQLPVCYSKSLASSIKAGWKT